MVYQDEGDQLSGWMGFTMDDYTNNPAFVRYQDEGDVWTMDWILMLFPLNERMIFHVQYLKDKSCVFRLSRWEYQ